MEKLIHNPRCGKSREALKILSEKGILPELKLYMKDPLTENELKEILTLLDISASDLLRRNETIYKEHYKGKELSENEWIKVMIKNPKLIERPIFIKGDKAIVGRPPEFVLSII